MRSTAFLFVAATFALAAGAANFWSGNRADLANRAAAQDLPANAARIGGQEPQHPPSLEARLNQRLDIQFVETPLQDAVQFLSESTGIQFVLNVKKLDEAGVSADSPVTKSLKQVRLATALDLLLEELELTYVEKDELLMVTTPEDAESKLLIRVYDCRDLLAMPEPEGAKQPAAAAPAPTPPPAPANAPAQPAATREAVFGCGSVMPARKQSEPATEHERKAERFMTIITTNVDQPSWDRMGGIGAISEYNGLLVVTHTAEKHKKVERLLDMLRYAAGFARPLKEKVVR